MHHLLIDLAEIGCIIVAAAIAVSAMIGTSGMYEDGPCYLDDDDGDGTGI